MCVCVCVRVCVCVCVTLPLNAKDHVKNCSGKSNKAGECDFELIAPSDSLAWALAL